MDPKLPLEVDPERQAQVETPSPEVPDDGSLREWAVVAGSWLASESPTTAGCGILLIISVLYFRIRQQLGSLSGRVVSDLTRNPANTYIGILSIQWISSARSIGHIVDRFIAALSPILSWRIRRSTIRQRLFPVAHLGG
jgi:hypothetical protein